MDFLFDALSRRISLCVVSSYIVQDYGFSVHFPGSAFAPYSNFLTGAIWGRSCYHYTFKRSRVSALVFLCSLFTKSLLDCQRNQEQKTNSPAHQPPQPTISTTLSPTPISPIPTSPSLPHTPHPRIFPNAQSRSAPSTNVPLLAPSAHRVTPS